MKMHHSRNSHSGSSSDRNSLASNDGEMTWDLLREAIFFFKQSKYGHYPEEGGGFNPCPKVFGALF